jgi:hypothetical protein|tara:strand:- start:65 stop:244 length:180 start_codon:yes stop_codon:yes gene_type:complete
MKIAEETGDDDVKENAKVNFGMANASLKWNNHVTGLLQQVEGHNDAYDKMDQDEEDKEN